MSECQIVIVPIKESERDREFCEAMDALRGYIAGAIPVLPLPPEAFGEMEIVTIPLRPTTDNS